MNEYKIYKDFSIDAKTDEEGKLIVLEGKKALENAILQWVSSFKGEYIRNPNKGGYVTKWLLKPMTEETQQSIKEAILEGFYEDFNPEVVLTKLEVNPIYEKRIWEIIMEGYSPTLKQPINIEEKLRNLI